MLASFRGGGQAASCTFSLLGLLVTLGCHKNDTVASQRANVPPPVPANRVAVKVTDQGFDPDRIPARAGVPLTLSVTRTTEKTCATEILFRDLEGRTGPKTDLPLGKTVEVTYTPPAAGTVRFGCAMGMMISGTLVVTD